MSNNKQIEKHLELPHQETIVGINTIQTKPFDNQKITKMSNKKQSSVDVIISEINNELKIIESLESSEIMGRKIGLCFAKRIAEQTKSMHEMHIRFAFNEGKMTVFNKTGKSSEEYYNETFGGNK